MLHPTAINCPYYTQNDLGKKWQNQQSSTTLAVQ